MPFNELHKGTMGLRSKDMEASMQMTTVQRVAAMRPNGECLWSLVLGMALVFGAYAARLRWPKWPIHPILFLFWETWASSVFFWSFLLAWFIQSVVTTYCPRTTYTKTKDFMIGVIAGELTGGLLWLVVGAVYYQVTREAPPPYSIFP